MQWIYIRRISKSETQTHPVHGSNSKVKAGWPLISVECSSGTNLACLLANSEL